MTAAMLTLTLLQSDLFWEDKQANLDMFAGKIGALKQPQEIVLLPEMFSTGFSMDPARLAEPMDGPTFRWMKTIAAENKIVLTGSFIVAEEGRFYNRLVWMLPNGQFGYYDKRHLFSYAGEDANFSRGSRRLITSVKGWRLNLQICYDLRFPVWSRQSTPLEITDSDEMKSAPEYDVLIYLANWPEKRIHSWKTLLQARAIENQCYVAGVNRTGLDGNNVYYSGDSMVVDPLGKVIQTVSGAEAAITCTLPLDKLEDVRTRMPFLKDGDRFIIGV